MAIAPVSFERTAASAASPTSAGCARRYTSSAVHAMNAALMPSARRGRKGTTSSCARCRTRASALAAPVTSAALKERPRWKAMRRAIMPTHAAPKAHTRTSVSRYGAASVGYEVGIARSSATLKLATGR